LIEKNMLLMSLWSFQGARELVWGLNQHLEPTCREHR
jgi:hypothetical protein